MPLFLIERTIPNASRLTKDELSDIAAKSLCASKHLPGYRWHTTYIMGDRMLCVHEARDIETVREHSRRGGFPLTSVTCIDGEFGPAFAEGSALLAASS